MTSHNADLREELLSRTMRRRGALILSGFGLLWALVGATALSSGEGWSVRLAAVSITAAAVAELQVLRRQDQRDRVRTLPAGWRRQVGVVNLVQAVTIVVVVVGAVVLDQAAVIPPLVALVVGAHFVPLARLFDQPEYRWTAAGLGAAALVGLVTLLAGGPESARATTGLMAAATLWVTAFVVALRR